MSCSRIRHTLTSAIAAAFFLLPSLTRAELATSDEMARVCQNWLTTIVDATGSWGGSLQPEVADFKDLYDNGQFVARCFFIQPSGHVVVPVLKEMPPIKAYSDETGINLDDNTGYGYAQLLRDVFRHRYDLYTDTYGSLDARQPDTGAALFARVQRANWDTYTLDPNQFAARKDARDIQQAGPLLQLEEAIHANSLLREVEGQISIEFTSRGLRIQMEDLNRQPLFALGSPAPTAKGRALLEAISRVLAPLPNPILIEEHTDSRPFAGRNDYSAVGWFNLIKSDIDEGLPVPYTIYSHEIVADGWRELSGMNQYHMNYGWDDSHNKWYTVDEVHCPWSGCNPYNEYAVFQLRPDRGVMFDAAPTLGWAPVSAAFTGSSTLDVSSWFWSFGDGQHGYQQNLTHQYVTPGVYDVSLQVTAGSETRERTRFDYIVVLADSLIGEQITAEPGTSVTLHIYARNTIPIQTIKVPISIEGSMAGLEMSSFDTDGCRTDYFEIVDFSQWLSPQQFTLRLVCSNSETQPPLQPGAGSILNLTFTVPGSAAPGDMAQILLGGYGAQVPEFTGNLAQYTARTVAGEVAIPGGSCCVGKRGNVSYDTSDAVNVVDLTCLVEYLFNSGPAPLCVEEANVNADAAEAINVVDLTYLVDYLFGDGAAPASCR